MHEVRLTAGERAARRDTPSSTGQPARPSKTWYRRRGPWESGSSRSAGGAASALTVLEARRCHLVAWMAPGVSPRLLCSRVLLNDRCVRAVTGVPSAVGYPVELVTPA